LPVDTVNSSTGIFSLDDIIVTDLSSTIKLRAIAPQPGITIQTKGELQNFELNNIAHNAKLTVDGKGVKSVDEQIDGITRRITINCASAKTIKLNWHLGVDDGFDFAILGDTGGGDELAWALKRAQQLDSQFLLHLGDFNYSNDEHPNNEYQQAIDKFKSSPIPVYVSIGNHDFNQSGLVYQRFINELGPMNSAFELAGSQFINVDTAANFLPAGGGHRGDLFRQLKSNQAQYSDRLFFTHRPLRDPRPHKDHVAGELAEIQWLAAGIKALNSNSLVTGHVHHSAELDVKGVHQWTAGEGLGHEDLVLQKRVAQLLTGRVEPAKKIQLSWVNLNMPWASHTSHTHAYKLLRDNRRKQLDWYRDLVGLS